jgi:hypothetical protein
MAPLRHFNIQENGKTMEQCREETRKNTEILIPRNFRKRRNFMDKSIEVADYDEGKRSVRFINHL